ncbi:MAG: hypothetical protein RLZZ628_4146 [Bacteroidota bacterium]|jgi:hypothetical protein
MQKKHYTISMMMLLLSFATQLCSQTVMLTTDLTLGTYAQNIGVEIAPVPILPVAFFAKYAYEANRNPILSQLEINMPTKTFEAGLKYYFLAGERPKRLWSATQYLKPNSHCPGSRFSPYQKTPTATIKDGLYVGLAYLHRTSNLDIKVFGDLTNLHHAYFLDFKGINTALGIQHHLSHFSIGISAQLAALAATTTHSTLDSPNLALIPVKQLDIFGQKHAFRFEPSFLCSVGVNF